MRWILTAQLLLSGCAALPQAQSPAPAAETPSPSAQASQPEPVDTPTATAPTVEPSPAAVVTLPAPTAVTAAPFAVCSPLEGIPLEELRSPDLLKNPFQAPRPGWDDGHHGADFAYWTRGERSTMQGHPILAVLPGKVVGVIDNRVPYGNALIIETPLDALPGAYVAALAVPEPQPTVSAASSLYCPAGERQYGRPGERSLYLLYAHMDQPATVAAGDMVECGEPLGFVGTTGKSVNYHLHLEARVGPAGSVFPSFTHYDTSATEAEMSAYCTWRVSGLFQMFDPLVLFPTPTAAPSLQP